MNVTEEQLDNMSVEQLEDLEDQLEDDQDIGYGAPEPEKKDSLLRFFREWITTKDSKKIGNLTNVELGNFKLPVREELRLANFCKSQNLEELQKYFEERAEITLATSMSRKGWFGNLTVTQIKKQQKIKDADPQKKGWFSNNNQQQSQEASQ